MNKRKIRHVNGRLSCNCELALCRPASGHKQHRQFAHTRSHLLQTRGRVSPPETAVHQHQRDCSSKWRSEREFSYRKRNRIGWQGLLQCFMTDTG